MQERTGAIVALDELNKRMMDGTPEEREAAILESEGYIEIPGAELQAVQRMNRKQRRAWAAQQRSRRPEKVKA